MKFIFYDFECTQEEGKHVPNFVVEQSICNKCEKDPVTSEAMCKNCGSHCNLCDKFEKKKMNGKGMPVMVVVKGK